MSQLEFVTKEVKREIKFFRDKRNHNRRMTALFVAASATLSGTATIMLGAAKMVGIQWFEVVALVASGLATIIGAIDALLSYRKLWHVNNVALAGLDELQRDIDFRMANEEPIDESETKDFYSRLSKIIMEADSSWVSTYAVK